MQRGILHDACNSKQPNANIDAMISEGYTMMLYKPIEPAKIVSA